MTFPLDLRSAFRNPGKGIWCERQFYWVAAHDSFLDFGSKKFAEETHPAYKPLCNPMDRVLAGFCRETLVKLWPSKIRTMMIHCYLPTGNIWSLGSIRNLHRTRLSTNSKIKPVGRIFHCSYCPRSSMDRVTDFESGGCAFEPRRGRLIFMGFSICLTTHPKRKTIKAWKKVLYRV